MSLLRVYFAFLYIICFTKKVLFFSVETEERKMEMINEVGTKKREFRGEKKSLGHKDRGTFF